MTRIHSTAVVAPGAQIWGDVEIGPYCVIGEHVQIDSGTVIGPHVVIDGHTTIGRDNQIYQFASLGAASQDKKYNGEPTRLEIGDRNTIREFVTMHRGTVQDNSLTKIGSDNWIMNYVHVAHDCIIGDHTILANNATLAGHVELGDYVFLGGFTTVHQFCRIGAHAMSAFTAAISQDVPPFVTAAGNRAAPTGLNSEGLRRRGFSADHILQIKRAYRTLYRSGLPLQQAQEQLQLAADAAAAEDSEAAPSLQLFSDFVRASKRGVIR